MSGPRGIAALAVLIAALGVAVWYSMLGPNDAEGPPQRGQPAVAETVTVVAPPTEVAPTSAPPVATHSPSDLAAPPAAASPPTHGQPGLPGAPPEAPAAPATAPPEAPAPPVAVPPAQALPVAPSATPPPAAVAPVGSRVVLDGQALVGQLIDMRAPIGLEDQTSIRIASPGPNEEFRRGTVTVSLAVVGLPKGATLRYMLDDGAPTVWKDPSEPLQLKGLQDGQHFVRVYALNEYHETIKSLGAYAATQFLVGRFQEPPPMVDLAAPMIVYNLPSGTHKNMAGHRVKVDWMMRNVPLGEGGGGYKIRMSIDNQMPVDLTTWTPAWLESLPPGKHRISLAIVDSAGRPMATRFNRVQGTFTIERER